MPLIETLIGWAVLVVATLAFFHTMWTAYRNGQGKWAIVPVLPTAVASPLAAVLACCLLGVSIQWWAGLLAFLALVVLGASALNLAERLGKHVAARNGNTGNTDKPH